MNQYKTLITIMFFLSTFIISSVYAKSTNKSLLGSCIYLDAGHGGKDSGAISNTFLEKDMNLILVKKLAIELTKKGVMVFLTRDDDYDLSTTTVNRKRDDLYNRALLINESKCNMYISIHMNSSTNIKWSGIQIFYSDNIKENKKIAQTITKTLTQNMDNIKEYKKDNSYYMYSKIKVPGILLEAGFISNPNDNYKIRQEEYQDTLVNNIVKGIEKYFQN